MVCLEQSHFGRRLYNPSLFPFLIWISSYHELHPKATDGYKTYLISVPEQSKNSQSLVSNINEPLPSDGTIKTIL